MKIKKMKTTNITNNKLDKKFDKRAVIFDMPFSVMFAIIAGVFILLLAIFTASRFIKTTQYSEQTESAKSLLNLLNPVVNDITSSYAPAPIKFNKETRIYLGCYETSSKSPVFGRQVLSFSEKSGFLKRWPDPSANITRYNKYIFSDNIEQGKMLYIFSKPFYTGYRVDDLIMMSMKNYCFVSSPLFVEEEISNLNLINVNISDKITACSSESVKVCFNFQASGCDVLVYPDCNGEYCNNEFESYDTGYVIKDGKTNYYFNNLIYAAILSSPEIYKCNVNRLLKKSSELGGVYKDKIDLLKAKECNSLVGEYIDVLVGLNSKAIGSNSTQYVKELLEPTNQMDERNCDNSLCRVYNSEKC